VHGGSGGPELARRVAVPHCLNIAWLLWAQLAILTRAYPKARQSTIKKVSCLAPERLLSLIHCVRPNATPNSWLGVYSPKRPRLHTSPGSGAPLIGGPSPSPQIKET